MLDNKCDVCGKPAIGVCSSSFGAVSWSLCRECVNKPAEPACMFEYLFDDVSNNGDGVAEFVNKFHTVIDGEYVSWPEYVKRRRSKYVSQK